VSFTGCVFAYARPIPGCTQKIAGSTTVHFNPQRSGGEKGTWQAVIISPTGRQFSGPRVRYDDVDSVSVPVFWDSDVIETGTYSIEIKNDIKNDLPSCFLSSIVVEGAFSGQTDLTFRDIPALFRGESTVFLFHVGSCAQ